jgi:hypothetical protein
MARRRPKDIGSLVVCALQNAIRWKQQCEPANATRASCGNRHQKGKRDRHGRGYLLYSISPLLPISITERPCEEYLAAISQHRPRAA